MYLFCFLFSRKSNRHAKDPLPSPPDPWTIYANAPKAGRNARESLRALRGYEGEEGEERKVTRENAPRNEGARGGVREEKKEFSLYIYKV